MKRLRDKKIDNARFYEKIWGEEYNQRPYYDAVRQRALAATVTSYDRVLDVGAGVFGTAQYIYQHEFQIGCPGVQLFAWDQSYTAKEIVDKLGYNIEYYVGPAEKIMFPDNFFEVVVAGEIIEHMEYPFEFAEELCRLSKRDVVISTVDTKCENAIKHGPYEEHLWEFEPQDLIDMFQSFGKTEYKLVGDYHMIYCRKG